MIAEKFAGGRDATGPGRALDNLSSAALCARLGGDASRAALLAERAITVSERMFGAPDIQAGEALYDLGLAQLAVNDVDGALASSERLDRWAEPVGHWIPIMAAHLRGSVALARA